MRPDGVRARVDDSADSMKHHSLREEKGKGEAGLTEGVGYRDFLSCQPPPECGKGAGPAAPAPDSLTELRRGAEGQAPAPVRAPGSRLFDLDLGALLLERGLDLLGLVLGDALLDGLRERV